MCPNDGEQIVMLEKIATSRITKNTMRRGKVRNSIFRHNIFKPVEIRATPDRIM